MSIPNIPGSFPSDKFEIIRPIGKGTYGKVYECKPLPPTDIADDKVAIKYINLQSKVQTRESLRTEINALKRLNEMPNIMRLYSVIGEVDYDNEIYLVCEFCHMTLTQLVKEEKRLQESLARNIFQQIVNGCHRMYDNCIMHRDLKPDNILLRLNESGGYNVRIADFGLAKFESETNLSQSYAGTPYFMAPEVVQMSPDIRGRYKIDDKLGYDYRAECFSLGLILLWMLRGGKVYKSITISQFYNEINSIDWNIDSLECSDDAKDLLKQLLEKESKKRITHDALINHKFVASKSPLQQSGYSLEYSTHDTFLRLEGAQNNEYIHLSSLFQVKSIVGFTFHDRRKIFKFAETELRTAFPKQRQTVKQLERGAHLAWIFSEFIAYTLKKTNNISILISTSCYTFQYLDRLEKVIKKSLLLKELIEEKSERVIAIQEFLSNLKRDLKIEIRNLVDPHNPLPQSQSTPSVESLLFSFAKQLAHEAVYYESMNMKPDLIEPYYWRAALLFQYFSESCDSDEDNAKCKELYIQTATRLKYIQK